MSSHQPPRQLSSEQLTSDGETFPELKDVVVKLEEEVDGQYRLLDFTRIPLIILHRTDSVEHCVKKEDDNLNQQIYNQDPPEPQQIKEEHDELQHLQIKVEKEISISKDEDQHVVKQETDTFMVTTSYEEIQQTESRPNKNQLISQDATETEAHDLERNHGVSGSTKGNGGQRTSEQKETQKQKRCKKTQEHKLYLCKTCDENHFKNSLVTEETHRLEWRLSCENCEKTFGPNVDVSHTGKKPFSCKVCGKYFSKKRHLSQHVTLHSGEKPFSCEICGKSFSQKRGLSLHMTVHTGEKPFSCEVCGKSFSQKNKLSRHMTVHTGEKPFSCKVCGKGFSQKSHLPLHMTVHTGEKPFLCKVCGKGFSQKSHLSQHVTLHTGEKPFSCNICGKGFSQKRGLSLHMTVHTGEKPFSCKLCGRGFGQKNKLSRHMTVHTGEKPFSCKVCGQSFSQKSHLSQHMTLHTGEKPFSCKLCGKSFRQKNNLSHHMKFHT